MRTRIPPRAVIYHRFHLDQFCDSDGGVEKGGEEKNRREGPAYQWIVKVAGGKRYKPGVKVNFLIYGMRERAIPLLCGSGCALGHSGGLARGSSGRRHEKK